MVQISQKSRRKYWATCPFTCIAHSFACLHSSRRSPRTSTFPSTMVQISQKSRHKYWATHLFVCSFTRTTHLFAWLQLTCPFACWLARFTHPLACIEAADHPGHPHFHPLWFRSVKNQDVNTGSLTCLFARSLTLLIHLLVCIVAADHPGHPHFHPL